MKFKRLIKDARGMTAVEFALVCPALFLFIFGTIELGRFMFAYNSMDAALAMAVRQWMIDPGLASSELETVFCSRKHLLDCAQTEFTYATEILDGREWRVVTARANFESPLHPLVPLPKKITVSERLPIF